MKNSILLILFICFILSLQTLKAQEPVAMLEHNGTSQAFYGQAAFVSAYNASANGDKIFLSAGTFNSPATIARNIKIFGAGRPDENGVQKRTTISSGINVDKGSDSLRIEGVFVQGNVTVIYRMNYLSLFRCNIINVVFSANCNYCSLEECFITGSWFGDYVQKIYIRNNVVCGAISGISSNALIENNIFQKYTYNSNTRTIDPVFININSSLIRNNIFTCGYDSYYLINPGNNNTINNNRFYPNASIVYGTQNSLSQNSRIDLGKLFINGNTITTIDYSFDYHLKYPEDNLGTDGTQVGLYGGLGFKENGLPSTPAITSKTIATKTDANGNLQISITAKAQDN